MKKHPFPVMVSGLILVLAGSLLLDILWVMGVMLMFAGLLIFFAGLFLLSAQNKSVCPNCGYEIYRRPGLRHIRGGRFPCPKCGALIQGAPRQ